MSSTCCVFQSSDTSRLAVALKALAHPVRLQIVHELSCRDCCSCGDMCECFSLSQSTVSQHLSVLKDVGVVDFKSDGNKSIYSLNRKAFLEIRDQLTSVLSSD